MTGLFPPSSTGGLPVSNLWYVFSVIYPRCQAFCLLAQVLWKQELLPCAVPTLQPGNEAMSTGQSHTSFLIDAPLIYAPQALPDSDSPQRQTSRL
jgi:hypothetical protein